MYITWSLIMIQLMRKSSSIILNLGFSVWYQKYTYELHSLLIQYFSFIHCSWQVTVFQFVLAFFSIHFLDLWLFFSLHSLHFSLYSLIFSILSQLSSSSIQICLCCRATKSTRKFGQLNLNFNHKSSFNKSFTCRIHIRYYLQ